MGSKPLLDWDAPQVRIRADFSSAPDWENRFLGPISEILGSFNYLSTWSSGLGGPFEASPKGPERYGRFHGPRPAWLLGRVTFGGTHIGMAQAHVPPDSANVEKAEKK